MTQTVFVGERLSFGSRSIGVGGFALSAEAARQLSANIGETWELNFYADKPVSSEQFLSLAEEFQSEPVEIISFMPVTDRHFRAIVEWREHQLLWSSSSREWDGVRYTVTAAPYSTEKLPNGGGEIVAEEEKKISTGAMVGIGAAVVAVGGGTVYYLSTRKKKRRRRRAA